MRCGRGRTGPELLRSGGATRTGGSSQDPRLFLVPRPSDLSPLRIDASRGFTKSEGSSSLKRSLRKPTVHSGAGCGRDTRSMSTLEASHDGTLRDSYRTWRGFWPYGVAVALVALAA